MAVRCASFGNTFGRTPVLRALHGIDPLQMFQARMGPSPQR
ncbi:hypothetical protein [Luteimonas sp. SDU101]